MDLKELIASLAEYDEMEAPDGMNMVEEVNEAKIEQGSFDDIEVNLDIMNGGIVCRGETFEDKNLGNEKTVDFSFVSQMQAKPFKAPIDNEYDPKQIAKECAEILKKHLDPAEQEIIALLDKYGYRN